jgi:MerR family transcriptional regulator, aldehyde-responsive regulator
MNIEGSLAEPSVSDSSVVESAVVESAVVSAVVDCRVAAHPAADTPVDGTLTPAEMASRTGVTIDTLRYYEREGLLQNVARADSGHRRYSNDDVLWVEVLRCLRETGMSIDQLRTYCDLGAQGDHTAPERHRMLAAHRDVVEQQIAERIEALRLIDHKLSFYAEIAAASQVQR